VLRQIAGCHYCFEIDVYRQLVGLWRLTICGVLSIEIVPLNDASVREDVVGASFGLEDVVEDRIEGCADRHICFVEFHVGSQGLGCFLTPFDVHVKQVKVPAPTCCKSISDGKAHTTGYKVIRDSSWALGKEEAPPPVISATLAILTPLDCTFVAIVRRSGNPNKECFHCGTPWTVYEPHKCRHL
jgi:hypothetical protein